jgi:branched-chain amino acid transport system substrate-binding protein
VSRSSMSLPPGRGGRPPLVVSRRSVLSLGALGAAAAALSACGSPAIGSTVPPDGPDLVVGACLELSGPNKIVGQAQLDAIGIVQSTIQDQGGFVVGGFTRQVRVITMDNQGDPKQASQMVRTLANQRGVSAIVGASGATTSIAMAPVAETLSTPMLSLSAAGAVTDPINDRRFVFKLGPDASDVAKDIVDAITSNRRARVAVMASDDPHGTDGIAALTVALHNGSRPQTVAEVRFDGSTPIDSGYAAQARAIVTAQPDAVVVWSVAPAASAAARALATAGFRGDIYFDSGAAASDTLTTVKPKSFGNGGVYVVSPQILAGSTQPATTPSALAQRDFFLRYTQKDVEFDGLSTYAADALRIIINSAILCQSFDRSAMRDKIETNTFDGISGSYEFTTTAHGGVKGDSLATFRLATSGWIQIT